MPASWTPLKKEEGEKNYFTKIKFSVKKYKYIFKFYKEL